MSEEMAEQSTEVAEVPVSRPATKGGPKPAGQKRQAGPLEGPLTQADAMRGYHNLFTMASSVLRSDAVWEEGEFKALAQATITLVNKLPALKVVLRVLGLFAAVGEMVAKVRKLMDGRRKRGQQPGGRDQQTGLP